MKKITKLTLCGLAALMLVAGCSKKDDNKEVTPTEEQAATETIAEGTTSPGEITRLGTYKGVEVTKASTAVTDEELEAKIQDILAKNPEYVEISDRPAQLGDIANIDFIGMKDGVAFDGGTSNDYDLELGSGNFINGFEEGILGSGKGAELSLNLTFPDPYPNNPELAGQPVVFDVTVNSIKQKKEAELDNNFVQRMSDFNTVDEFKADVLSDLETQKEEAAEKQLSDEILAAAVANSEFNVNPDYVEEIYNNQLDYFTSIMAQQGGSLSLYAMMNGMTEDELKQSIHESCEKSARQEILLKAVAEKEGFELEESDYQQLVTMYGMSTQELKSNFGAEMVDETAMMFKAAQFIEDNAVIK